MLKLFWISLALIVPSAVVAQTPGPGTKAKLAEAISNVLTSYNNATAYSATIVTKLSEGKYYQTTTVAVNINNDVKKGTITSARFERSQDIATKKLTQRSTDLTVDDGTNTIQMYPAMHEYAVIPRKPSRISDLLIEPLNTCLKFGIPLTAAERKLDGKMYYEILGSAAKGKVDILIDQDSIRVRSIHMEIVRGASTRIIDITVKDELFGKDVPATKFNTTPPTSFKKVEPIEDPDPWD